MADRPLRSRPSCRIRRGLEEGGFTEGQNVTIEYRWADISMTGCRMAAELVHDNGGDLCGGSVRAAKQHIYHDRVHNGEDPVKAAGG